MQMVQYFFIPLLLLFLVCLPFFATRWIAEKVFSNRFFGVGIALGATAFLGIALPNVILALTDHTKEAGVAALFTLYYGVVVTIFSGIAGAVVGYRRRYS